MKKGDAKDVSVKLYYELCNLFSIFFNNLVEDENMYLFN